MKNLIVLSALVGASLVSFNVCAMKMAVIAEMPTAVDGDTCLNNPIRMMYYKMLLAGLADGSLKPEEILAVSEIGASQCVLERVALEEREAIYETANRAIAHARNNHFSSPEAEKAALNRAYAGLIVLRDGLPAETRTRRFYQTYSCVVGDPRQEPTSAFSWQEKQ